MSHRWIFYSISFVATNAFAHPFDVSKSEFSVDGHEVHGHVEVAVRDLRGKTLDELVTARTQIALGTTPCSKPEIVRSWIEGEDGAAVDTKSSCPGAGDLSVSVLWLSDMPPEHRHVAHLSFGRNGLTAMLTRDHPTASLAPPPAPPTPPPQAPPRWPWYAGAAAALLAILASVKRLVSGRDTQK